MNFYLNCVNCGAPPNPQIPKCEYCGTHRILDDTDETESMIPSKNLTATGAWIEYERRKLEKNYE